MSCFEIKVLSPNLLLLRLCRPGRPNHLRPLPASSMGGRSSRFVRPTQHVVMQNDEDIVAVIVT